MSFSDLRSLHRLHLVDAAIVEIRRRAAALDPGKAIQTEIAAIQAQVDEVGGSYKRLAAEQSDLELQQKAIDAKVAQFEKELYSGKVVNPREVENINKEIASLKKRRTDLDDRLFELMELIPPAQQAAQAVDERMQAKRQELAAHQKRVVETKTKLEQQFKEVSAKRAPAVAEVPVAMLSRYEAIRQKAAGVGMADVVRGGFCGMCGTHLPEKLIESAREGRIAMCESCHRILYASEGLV